MSRLNSRTVREYEEMLAQVARQEGYDVEDQAGTFFMVLPVYTVSGEETLTRVNITRFAETMARSAS
jgi:hypothetical protein